MTETNGPGVDRRSLLKKGAAAGALVWAAPAVTGMSTAQAVEFIPGTTCTAKCAPTVQVTVIGKATVTACDKPPGQNNVVATILAAEDVTFGGVPCPCGGNPEITLIAPVVGEEFEVRPKPGNEQNEGAFDIVVYVSCFDRSGDRVWRICSATATAFIKPGSCQGTLNKSFDWQAETTCGEPGCGDLPPLGGVDPSAA